MKNSQKKKKSGISGFLEIPEFPEKISTVQMRYVAVAVVQTTVQTVQTERITYLLEHLLGEGVKEP